MTYIPILQPSKLDLAAECLYPWTSGTSWGRDDQSKWGRFGDAVHWFADGYVRGVRVDLGIMGALALASGFDADDARRLPQAALDVMNLLDEETVDWRRSEIRIAYDPIRGTVRELDEDRSTVAGDRAGGEMLLKIDLLFGSGSPEAGKADHVVVRDWKTGRRPVLRRVEESRQVGIYAVAVAKLLKVQHVTIELAWISDRGIWLEPARFDVFDFDAIEDEVRHLALEQRRGRAVPRYGLHCKEHYCPIMAKCPAATRAADEVAAASTNGFPSLSATIQSPEHAADMLARVPLARKRLDEIETSLGDWVRKNGAVDVGDGRSWGWVEHQGRESIKLDEGAKIILGNHLGDHRKLAIETSEECSKASIDRAIKRAVLDANDRTKGAQKKRREPLLNALREAGALKRGAAYEKFEVFVRGADGGGTQQTEGNEGEAA